MELKQIQNKKDIKGVITATKVNTINVITNTRNKHTIPIANKPMVKYAVEKLVGLGIKDIAIIVSEGEKDIQEIIGNGSEWNISIQYIVQEKGDLGIVSAIHSSYNFLGDSSFVLHLGDNIIIDDLNPALDEFINSDIDCMLMLNRTKNANQFGVPVFDDNGKILRIEERPTNPASEYAVCGVYFYTPLVHKMFSQMKLSQRGVYEISEMHSNLISSGYSVGYKYVNEWWKDRGSVEDILRGNRMAFDFNKIKYNPYNNKDNNVKIDGNVLIDPSSVISGNTTIRGPVVIGGRCLIKDSFIGSYTSIGDGVELHNANVQNSILFEGASITSTNPITDSVIGEKSIINDSQPPFDYSTQVVVGDNSILYL